MEGPFWDHVRDTAFSLELSSRNQETSYEVQAMLRIGLKAQHMSHESGQTTRNHITRNAHKAGTERTDQLAEAVRPNNR